MGFFKGSQSSNKTANIGEKTCKHSAHTDCSKNYKILLLFDTDQHFDTKGVKWLSGQASFWVKFPTVQAKLRSNPWGMHGEGGDGRFWNWLVHNNSFIEYINSTFHSEGSRVSRKLISSSSDERFTSELALELELELEWWDERPCWRRWRFASNHLPTGSILREDGAKTIAENAPQLLQIKS